MLSREFSRLARWYVYFRRGHSGYLAFLVALANFVVIQYRLLIQYIPSLQIVFQSLTTFIIVFVATYLPLTIVIGWLDYKKFIYPREAAISTEANPYAYKPWPKEKIYWQYYLEVFKVLEKLAEEKGLDTVNLKEARRKVEEWLKT